MYFAKEVLDSSSEMRRKWEDEVKKVIAKSADQKPRWSTVSDLEIKRLYTPEDIKDMDFAKDIGYPNQFPFLRGNQPTGYRGKYWTFRMFSGMGDAKTTNTRWHLLLKEGQTGLSTAFDFPTLMGYDTDSPKARGECGKCGVAIDTLEDFMQLTDGIPMDKVTTSMTINPPATALWAMYCAAADIRGIPLSKIGGTIQNDMLKEFIAQKTLMCPPDPSVKLISDTVEFGTKYVPRWNTISISGYHIREAGATAVQELAFTLRDGMEYVEDVLRRKGLDVDEFAPRLSFFFNSHIDFFEEIAKLRAARRIWAKAMRDRYKAKDPRSWWMRFHTQTAGCSLTAQQPYNNVVRTATEALAAVLGGTQSLHTNSFDEAVSLPTPLSSRIARNTQIIIQEESQICRVVDPLGGSYYVEALTASIIREAKKIMDEIEELGGMARAIETGMPKMRIEESAARRQARIDQGKDTIVGVNKYKIKEEAPIDVLDIPASVRDEQIARLRDIKARRDAAAVQKALERITQVAEKGGNLLDASIDAVRLRATVGEVSDAMEKVFGRYVATTRVISGAYSSEYGDDEVIRSLRARTEKFLEKNGRRPRQLVTKMGQDGHDRGIKVVATAYADVGFDVDISPMFQTPEEAAKMAIENDVHVVGVSSLAAGHKTLVPELIEQLKKMGGEDIIVVVGGVIPPADYDFLYQKGVKGIFGPGTAVTDSADRVLQLLEEKYG